MAEATYQEYDNTGNRCNNYTASCNNFNVDNQLDWIADGTVIVGTGVTSSIYGKVEILPNANNITFTGFIFDGSRDGTTDSPNNIVFESGAGPVTFTDCTIRYAADNGDLLKMATDTDGTFNNCTFTARDDATASSWTYFTGNSVTFNGGSVLAADGDGTGMFEAYGAGVTGTIVINGMTITESAGESVLYSIKIADGDFDTTITNNVFNPLGSICAYIEGQTDVDFSNNTITDEVCTACSGLSVQPNASMGNANSILVSDNIVNFPSSNSSSAISVGEEGTSANDNKLNGAIVSHNTLNLKETGSLSTHGIHIGHITSAYVYGNTINGGNYGVVVEHTTGNPWSSGGVYGNVFRNCDYSILLKGASGVPVENNSIYCAADSCDAIIWWAMQTGDYAPENDIIKNNAIYLQGNGVGDFIYNFSSGTTTGHVIDQNCVYATGTYSISTEGASWAQWQASALSPDAHSINADPQFNNVASDDFGLSPNSPCIDTGTDLGDDLFYSFTGDNQDRFGRGWEIGAYVFPQSGGMIGY